MEEDYTTSPFIVDGFGRIDYENETVGLYDFVDDNDDQDRKPEQVRLFQDPRTSRERALDNAGLSAQGFADDIVFPGWDENNDFISDFNQNDNPLRENYLPDYDEPFLRYASDRPEFLFGLDLNNNGWVDRFENDNEPDYPYRKDHQGYNVYLQNQITPQLKLTLGQVRAHLISDDRKNLTTYGLFTLEKDYVGLGKVQFFNMLKKAADNIQDDLVQWVQIPGESGELEEMEDPLFAQDTWIHTTWLGFERSANFGLNLVTRCKYETIRQRQDESRSALGGRRLKKNTRFWGLVTKADYIHELGRVIIRPKVKSEWLRDNTPYFIDGAVRTERDQWTGMLFLVLKFPVLWHTTVEMGLEQLFFQDMLVREDRLPLREFTGDFRSTVSVVQVANVRPYVGYKLTTLIGFKVARSSRERVGVRYKSQTENFVYLTMYAGLKE